MGSVGIAVRVALVHEKLAVDTFFHFLWEYVIFYLDY